jgi:hypothetical protein
MDELGGRNLGGAVCIGLSDRPSLAGKRHRPGDDLQICGVNYQIIVVDGTGAADRDHLAGEAIPKIALAIIQYIIVLIECYFTSAEGRRRTCVAWTPPLDFDDNRHREYS